MNVQGATDSRGIASRKGDEGGKSKGKMARKAEPGARNIKHWIKEMACSTYANRKTSCVKLRTYRNFFAPPRLLFLGLLKRFKNRL